MQPDPEFCAVSVDTAPAATEQLTWKDGAAHGHVGGGSPFLTFDLGKPRFVYAIRIKCTFENTASSLASVHLSWTMSQRLPFPNDIFTPGERKARVDVSLDTSDVLRTVDGKMRLEPPKSEKAFTVWVNASIDQFRVYPDTSPCVFRPLQITILVPVKERALPLP
jgi:hypothetical protein